MLYSWLHNAFGYAIFPPILISCFDRYTASSLYLSLWYSSYLCIGFVLWRQISSYPCSVLACCDLCSSQTIRCLCLLLHLCSYDVRLEYLCVNTSLSSWFVLTECCQGRLVHLFDQLQRPPPPITPVECFCHHYFPLSWVSSFNTSETCTNLLDPYDAIFIWYIHLNFPCNGNENTS